MEATTLLSENGGLPDTPGGWRRYRDYLGVLAEEDAHLRAARFGRLSRGWVIGTAEFKAGLKKELVAASGGDRIELLGAGREVHRQIRAEVWAKKLVAVAAALGVRLDRLPKQHSATEKVLLAVVMKRGTSVSDGWLARRLAIGQPGGVSQYVRRFGLSGGPGKKGFKEALSIVQA